MGEREELHQIIYKHVYKCLDVGILSVEFMSGPLWRATEAAAIEAGALAQGSPQPSDSDIGSVLGLFHRNACYPDAMPVEVSLATLQIRSLFAIRAPEAADAGAVSRSVTADIAHEFYQILERCGAKSDLLSIVGSYGDTASDKDVLDWLWMWNEEGGSIVGAERGALEKIAGPLFALDLEQDDMDVGADARKFLGEVRSIARDALPLPSTERAPTTGGA